MGADSIHVVFPHKCLSPKPPTESATTGTDIRTTMRLSVVQNDFTMTIPGIM